MLNFNYIFIIFPFYYIYCFYYFLILTSFNLLMYFRTSIQYPSLADTETVQITCFSILPHDIKENPLQHPINMFYSDQIIKLSASYNLTFFVKFNQQQKTLSLTPFKPRVRYKDTNAKQRIEFIS